MFPYNNNSYRIDLPGNPQSVTYTFSTTSTVKKESIPCVVSSSFENLNISDFISSSPSNPQRVTHISNSTSQILREESQVLKNIMNGIYSVRNFEKDKIPGVYSFSLPSNDKIYSLSIQERDWLQQQSIDSKYEGVIHIWDIESRKLIGTLEFPKRYIVDFAISHRKDIGDIIFTLDYFNAKILVWKINDSTPQLLCESSNDSTKGPINVSLDLRPNIRHYDPAKNKIHLSANGKIGCCIHKNSSYDNEILIWELVEQQDPVTQENSYTLRHLPSIKFDNKLDVTDYCLSSDGEQLCVCLDEKKISIWNTKDGSFVTNSDNIDRSFGYLTSCISDSNQNFYISSDRGMFLLSLFNEKKSCFKISPSTTSDGSHSNLFGLHPNGNILYSSDSRNIEIWKTKGEIFNTRDSLLLKVLKIYAKSMTFINMSPDGCKICLKVDNKIQIWNFAADITEILQEIANLLEGDDRHDIQQANDLLQKMPEDIQNAINAKLRSPSLERGFTISKIIRAVIKGSSEMI